ncbi:hypothetical protein F0562_012198 [Nyssa sinensis]|uniref:D-isomer specific 2-hydroxyacid dehydrogenase NAD-binding domain-containing protein n=1 Tax=Nyssa sinensis TaxID=561372 RepID=A0A5J4ZVP3_9ASTE|nr:hypothetical protein F0562_012198 [Nyssa sinensis]
MDEISLHPILDKTTYHLVNKQTLSMMKKEAILINCSRGPVADEVALVEHLKQNPMFRVGLDVFEDEPYMKPGLANMKNAIVVPHIASASKWTRERMATFAALNVLVYEHKYEIVKILQEKKHVCGMTGDGVNDAPALKKTDIGIAVADCTDAARSASDIVLTEHGLRTIMTISTDRVKPFPRPDNWKLNEIFATGIFIGTYLASITVLFYWVVAKTTFFETHFHVRSLSGNIEEISSAIYLQVSIISQALIFVTRSQSWSFLERPGALLMCAFVVAQLVATLIAVYADISFAFTLDPIKFTIRYMVIWLYSVIFYIPLDPIKFTIRYALSGEAWNLLFDRKTAFTSKKDYGKEDREAKWVVSQRTLQGLISANLEFNGRPSSLIAEQARRPAEIARLSQQVQQMSRF